MTGRLVSTGTRSVDIRGLNGADVHVDSAMLRALATRLRGNILRPSDAGFDDATRIWNGMIQKRPAIVVQPVSTADVREAVAFALSNRLLLSVKGGGHHVAGTALADGGLTLDMSRMRSVVVDPVRRLAHVDPGCRLGDVDRATQEHGLATVLGSDADTGVAGLTLGGGFGYLSRRFGWAVDNLEQIEIVTADGELRRAAADENEDLFWALRGGGGNFGVVTRFTFRLHPVGPTVTGGVMMWTASVAEQVLEAYRTVTEAAPRELSLALTMRLAPAAEVIPERLRGRPVVGILVCHSGDETQAVRDLAPFRKIEAALDTITRKSYVDQQFVLGFSQPAGLHQYLKSEFLPCLSDRFIDAYRAQAQTNRSPLSQLLLFQLGGAIGDRDPMATAMGNRDAGYVFFANGTWRPDDSAADAHLGWVRNTWEALAPYSSGGNYANAQSADEGEARTRAAYGDTFERLRQVKDMYDPDNFFRMNRNIRPAREHDGSDQAAGRGLADAGRQKRFSPDLEQAFQQDHAALAAFVTGDPEPKKRLYSKADDVTLANPYGPPARGWGLVATALERAAALLSEGEPISFERVSGCETADLAYIVEIERYRMKTAGTAHPVPVSLRVTTVFRRESGAWRVVHRHADPITTLRAADSVLEPEAGSAP